MEDGHSISTPMVDNVKFCETEDKEEKEFENMIHYDAVMRLLLYALHESGPDI
jgi:hypothetical protein